VGVIPLKFQRKISIVGSAPHRWMRETKCCLEQLMRHCGLWSDSDGYGVHKTVLPHVQTKEHNGLGS